MNEETPVIVKRRTITTETYAETPDNLFVAKQNYTEAQQNLVQFVEKQIDLMNKRLLFNGCEQPSFYDLQRSLMDYESVTLGLIALHNEARVEKEILQEQYDDYYAEKFCEIKLENTHLGKQAAFTSTKEIEMFVRQKYTKELSKLKSQLIEAENRYNFTNHLMTGWTNYQFVLSTLSKNAIAEATASGVSYKNPKQFEDE